MKKHFLVLLTFLLVSSFSITSNAAATDEKVKPIKTEQLTLEDGTVIPVYYFENPEDGDKHREEMAKLNNSLSQVNQINTQLNISPMAIGDEFKLVSYGGTLNYNFDVQYTYNGTSIPQVWKPSVSRSTSSTTSIKVSSGFDKAFQAEVGKTFSNTTTWSHAFDFTIPAKKQYEIWSWNVAENWTFDLKPLFGSSTRFSVYRPTTTYGHSIYIFDNPRNPR
ncbi:hypothetical protein [Metasolibacillus meyeri]|uniref:hypothetical protein n=1 Tax=Metasolibacillus meyeri TaxID=1071052 RepID=UPI000D31B045|nr:hypothetical protein [Metasolibacillus meyeri]